MHAPLPNVGAVLMHDYGPQLIVSDTYPVQLLSNVWSFLETPLEDGKKALFDVLMQPAVLESLGDYLKQLSLHLNRFLASNFFARSELKFVHQLLNTDGIETYLTNTQLLQLVYNYLCSLSSAQATQMKGIFERYLFSGKYVQLDEKSLQLLQDSCMEIVYSHFIAVNQLNIYHVACGQCLCLLNRTAKIQHCRCATLKRQFCRRTGLTFNFDSYSTTILRMCSKFQL